MYKCLICKSEFIEPDHGTIMHWEVDNRGEEAALLCPVCGTDEFEEVTLCKGCNEHYIESSKDYCDTCYQDVSDALNQLAELKKIPFATAVNLISSWIEKN